MTPAYDRAAVERIAAEPIPVAAKGWPPAAEGMAANAVGEAGWRLLDGDLPFPVLALRESALAHNLAVMREFCERNGALLAPHGKTTMAPRLFARQLDAGAWGMTAATPVHLRAYREMRIGRILLANQLVEPGAIAWLAAELDADPDFKFICLVDSTAGVELLDRELAAAGASRPVSVMVELGIAGARTGCRDADEALVVARAAARSERLRLAGVEGFEGLARGVEAPDAFLAELERAHAAIAAEGLFDGAGLVSAGGSAYFDRVVERFDRETIAPPRRLLLRGGCYLTHDDGLYERDSPLAGRGPGGPLRLANAIEVWSVVLSRPEPDLAITSMGKRDVGFDIELPTPGLAARRGDARPRALAGELLALSDQHAHVRIDPGDPLAVGDLVGSTVSHPCTTLDRWRVIAVVDDDYRVVDALHTRF